METDTPPLSTTRYAEPVRSLLHHPVAIVVRSILAFILALALLPFTVAAWVRLPSCLAVRLLERLAVCALMLIARVAAVEVLLRPRSEEHPAFLKEPGARALRAWLPAPLVRRWTSPLPRARFVQAFDQPGRWMTDEQLETLRATLEQVAVSSVGSVPTHRLFDRRHARATLARRVVSVAYDAYGALGFTATVYMDGPDGSDADADDDDDDDLVIHLGLTMIAARGRGSRLQSVLLMKSLVLACANLWRLSYDVTNCGASPAGIGSVGDYFLNAFPTYDGQHARQKHHVRIARHVLAKHRHEFGCSKYARFDERTFVVHRSNAPEGGGTHEFIRGDNSSPVSRYKVEACNKFVARTLDLQAGDELFQVATANVFASMAKYVTSPKTRRATK